MQPAMWGGSMDGKGQTLVYYFSLPEGWEPSQLGNPAALALAQRFFNSGREGDKCAPARPVLWRRTLPSINGMEVQCRISKLLEHS